MAYPEAAYVCVMSRENHENLDTEQYPLSPEFETGASIIRGKKSNRDLRRHWGNSKQPCIGRRNLSKGQMIYSIVSGAVPYVP